MNNAMIMIFDKNNNLIFKEIFAGCPSDFHDLHKRANYLIENPKAISPNSQCKPASYQIARNI